MATKALEVPPAVRTPLWSTVARMDPSPQPDDQQPDDWFRLVLLGVMTASVMSLLFLLVQAAA